MRILKAASPSRASKPLLRPRRRLPVSRLLRRVPSAPVQESSARSSPRPSAPRQHRPGSSSAPESRPGSPHRSPRRSSQSPWPQSTTDPAPAAPAALRHRVPRLDSNTRPHPHGHPRIQHRRLQGKQVIPQILAGMRHHRQPCTSFQPLNSQHVSILKQPERSLRSKLVSPGREPSQPGLM